jgi:APA family basic amino acid/polyamine antiporter
MKENDPQEQNDQTPFNRVLGLPTAVLLVAGIMIGSGTFKKIVPMAGALHNETYILLAWIIAGVVTMFGAFTYAGLANLTTQTGGVYEYLRLIYGDFIAFLFGWSVFTIVGSGAIAALAFVFSESVATLVHLQSETGVKVMAVLAILLLTFINYRGVKQGGTLNNVVTAAKIAGILLLIFSGLSYSGHPETTMASAPTAHHDNTNLFSALFGAMLSAFWAYDGWANITFVTGEIKNPQRNVPFAIIGGVGIAMLLYVLLNYTYMQVMSLQQLSQLGTGKIAAAEVAGVLMGPAGKVVVTVLIMVCTFGALNGCIISYPRVYFRMAQEKVFFKDAAKVHRVFRTPHIALFYSAAWSAVLIYSGTFDEITDLVIFASFAFFGLAAFGLIRMKMKGVIRAKVIGYPVIPVFIILFCLALVINTFVIQTKASLLGMGLILSGIPFYFYFKYRYR